MLGFGRFLRWLVLVIYEYVACSVFGGCFCCDWFAVGFGVCLLDCKC